MIAPEVVDGRGWALENAHGRTEGDTDLRRKMGKSNDLKEMEEMLRKLGLRMTQPRRVILDWLLKSNDHLLAKDIYLKINKTHPDIGLTTVYRTLDLLVGLGIINKFEFGEGQSRYEIAWDFKEHHHHLVCSGCGKIINYNDFIEDEVKFFNKIQPLLSRKYEFDIHHHEVYFYGECGRCTRSKRKGMGRRGRK